MSTLDKINELNNRRSEIENNGCSVAREKITNLLDISSFVEMGAFITHRSTDYNLPQKETPADGVITGFGTIDGRLVYVYSQDNTVIGGSIGEMGAKKIGKIYEQAMKMGAPVIALLDSAGVRLQEGLDSMEGYGEIFKYQTLASGVIPQISVVLGDSLGINSVIPALSDFVVMQSKKARMFVNSPNTANDLKSKTIDLKQAGSAEFHSKCSGLADFSCETQQECLNTVRELIGFIPSNNLEDAPLHGLADDLNRIDENLNNDGQNIKDIITAVADGNSFMEIKKDFATNIVTGFVRFNGYTAGIVANNGELNSEVCSKAVGFINMCDAFNIPLVTFTDVKGYISDLKEEKALSKEIAKLIYSFTNATVPKVNVIVGQAFGSAYIAMNSKHIGADMVYAWPNAEISLMEAEAAINVMYAEEVKKADKNGMIVKYKQEQSSPYTAAKRGYIDDIIIPAETRKYLIVALEMLESKRESRPAKKHGSIIL